MSGDRHTQSRKSLLCGHLHPLHHFKLCASSVSLNISKTATIIDTYLQVLLETYDPLLCLVFKVFPLNLAIWKVLHHWNMLCHNLHSNGFLFFCFFLFQLFCSNHGLVWSPSIQNREKIGFLKQNRGPEPHPVSFMFKPPELFKMLPQHHHGNPELFEAQFSNPISPMMSRHHTGLNLET